MSYILDALRKSDQQRQRATAPLALTAQATELAPKRPAFSFNVLLAAVLLGAGMLVGWLRPWQPVQPVAAPDPIAVKPEQQPPPQKPKSAAQSAPSSEGAVIKPDTHALARTEIPPPSSRADAGVAKEAAMPDKPMVTGLADAETEQQVMALSELPASIRREIPSMSMALHGYASNPNDRLVMINDKMLRQGDSLMPGIRLEQITPDGVIISYKNYRFHRGVR